MTVTSILVAVDGGPQTQRILSFTAAIALALEAAVHVLCVANIPLADGVDDPVFRTIEDQAQRVIHDAQDILSAGGLEAIGHVVDGSPAQIIASTAKELGCGLIIIGHRYLSFWGHLLDPSVCVELLDVTPCPVLTIPDGH